MMPSGTRRCVISQYGKRNAAPQFHLPMYRVPGFSIVVSPNDAEPAYGDGAVAVAIDEPGSARCIPHCGQNTSARVFSRPQDRQKACVSRLLRLNVTTSTPRRTSWYGNEFHTCSANALRVAPKCAATESRAAHRPLFPLTDSRRRRYASAPRPVLARTVSSWNDASAAGSCVNSAATIAAMKPSGTETSPGFSSGKIAGA